MDKKIAITGTFLDEITADIPGNNWSEAEWDAEFASMKEAGIKRLFMIRAGFNRTLAYPSRVIAERENTYPVYEDKIAQFLKLAGKYDMEFWPGNYVKISNDGHYVNDLDFDKRIADEIWEHYGKKSPAFGGWYFSKEIGKNVDAVTDVFVKLARHCKEISGNKPIMLSPWLSILPDAPRMAGGHIAEWELPPMDFERFRKDWEEMFGKLAGAVDIVAFQDGLIPYPYFEEICRIMKSEGEKHGVKVWINFESFDRDMPFRFPPINWRTLRYKLETASKVGIEEGITFEYSHFMSPYSMWPSAGRLRERYLEWLRGDLPLAELPQA